MPIGMVSVVVTTYKRELRILLEAIDSIKNQTYENIEIIVIDDNGIGTEQQAKNQDALMKYNLRYYPNKKNSGAQFSRNLGILLSKGDYVAFLDDDDLWDKTKIEKQMKMFGDENVGLVFSDGYVFHDGDMTKTTPYQDFPVFNRPITTEMELYRDYVGSTSQALVKKECFARVGLFDTDMPARQDYEMWLRISLEYKIVGVPEPLFYYRIHNSERITSSIMRQYVGMKKILEKYSKLYQKNKKAKAKVVMRLCRFSLDMKKYPQAVLHLIHSFVIHPLCTMQVIFKNK